MAYEGFKGLSRRIASDKLLRDKTFKIHNMMEIRELWEFFYETFFGYLILKTNN